MYIFGWLSLLEWLGFGFKFLLSSPVLNSNEGVFWNLKQLLRLDLSRNNIINIHSMAFQNGVPVLSQLDLANNLLGKIPFMAISSMKSLKTLDLSNNRIENIEDSFSKIKLKLDKLLLKENSIKVITKNSFQNFKWINYTSLRNNPIHTVQNHAFLDVGVRELDLHNCHIGNLNPGAFRQRWQWDFLVDQLKDLLRRKCVIFCLTLCRTPPNILTRFWHMWSSSKLVFDVVIQLIEKINLFKKKSK